MRSTTTWLPMALAALSGCSNAPAQSDAASGNDAASATETGGPDAHRGDSSVMVIRDSGTSANDSGISATDSGSTGAAVTYGQTFTGGVYNLGPVDYAETQFHNACAPGGGYDARVQNVEGQLLAGLWNGIPNVESYCDACIYVTTAMGRTALLRVVTYGDTSPNSIDVSPAAYDILNAGEFPRDMTWQFAQCPDTGPMMYEFQTASSEWWTSLWVRNARAPLAKVEVQSANHAQYVELSRGNGDGTLTDASGFGQGAFTIRTTSVDGQMVEDTFQWPAAGLGGAFLTGQRNFQ